MNFTFMQLQLNSWMTQIAIAVIGQHNDMGANLSSGRDFLELHERLNEDMKVAWQNLKSVWKLSGLHKVMA